MWHHEIKVQFVNSGVMYVHTYHEHVHHTCWVLYWGETICYNNKIL